MRNSLRCVAIPLLCLPVFANGIGQGHTGAVFVGTNHNNSLDSRQPPNQVALYMRATGGSLSLRSYYNTGGQGSGPSRRFAGDGLGAAHSVQLSQNRNWLFVTNAGSNNLSVGLDRAAVQRVSMSSSLAANGPRNGGPIAFTLISYRFYQNSRTEKKRTCLI